MFYRFYCTALKCVGCDGEVRKATSCVRSVVPSTHYILQIPLTAHVTNQVVRTRTVQSPVTQTIMARRLRFFGHIVRSDSDEDHKRWHRRPAEGLETTSRSSSTNVAAYNRKRPETTEPRSVVCPAQSI